MLAVAAKQEAFEESIKLKNQFRNLDEDEVEFLDSVLESTRAKEEAVKRETSQQLDLFKRQQDEADKRLREGENGREVEEGSPILGESEWTVGSKKRKRVKERDVLKGVKIRRSSSSRLGAASPDATRLHSEDITEPSKSTSVTTPKEGLQHTQQSAPAVSNSSKAAIIPASPDTSPKPKPVPGLGLAAYSSDEED